MALEQLGLAVVDARRVEADRTDPASHQQARGVGMEAREVELGHGLLAELRGAHVALAIGPEALVARPQQHDGAATDAPVPALMRPQVRDGDLIVAIGQRALRHVDDGAAADQPPQRDLVRRVAVLGEVHRRVQVRAAVLGRREVVGRVVVALLGLAVGDLLELERRRGRPVDRPLVERMREVDQPAVGERRRAAGACCGLRRSAGRTGPSDDGPGRQQRGRDADPPDHRHLLLERVNATALAGSASAAW